jgi:hypothetical protein
MKPCLTFAAFAALAALCLASHAEAGCVISPDGKSIDVVADNDSSDEKSCSVSCQVDTKIGVVQVACGGTTPPLAKAHSLCSFDKPDPWNKKIVSSRDSCKGESAAAAPAPSPAAAAATTVKPGTFICRISADGHSFDAVIANPYSADATCQVNCRISTTVAGTTEQSSCTKNVASGAGEVVLCTHSFDEGRLVKVVGGSGECYDPTPRPAATENPDSNADADEIANRPMPKPSGAHRDGVDLQGLGDDPAKLQDYIRRQLSPDEQKLLDQADKP